MNLNEDPRSFAIDALRVTQPIGTFFVGVIDAKRLCEITDFDIRHLIKERPLDTFLGIQRKISDKRVGEISEYVTTADACFPTAIVLSVSGDCATYDDENKKLTLSNYQDPENRERNVLYRQIAKVIDGQHRIEGLKEHINLSFELNVSIFVEIDVAEEAYIFSTVNLTQTKVNKSLVYDLFDLARARSPQKLCHNVAVALDANEKSPFYKRIKRLGEATEGRFNETLTQATVVESLLKYISKNPVKDKDIYVRGGTPEKADASESRVLIFRNMMIDNRDVEIVDVIWNYFDSIRGRWPHAWDNMGRGAILNKTNGFKGFMRFLRSAYLHLVGPGGVPAREDFARILKRVSMDDNDFNTDNFKPGTSGEVALYNALKTKSGI